jgi:hypothetical protein
VRVERRGVWVRSLAKGLFFMLSLGKASDQCHRLAIELPVFDASMVTPQFPQLVGLGLSWGQYVVGKPK